MELLYSIRGKSRGRRVTRREREKHGENPDERDQQNLLDQRNDNAKSNSTVAKQNNQ